MKLLIFLGDEWTKLPSISREDDPKKFLRIECSESLKR